MLAERTDTSELEEVEFVRKFIIPGQMERGVDSIDRVWEPAELDETDGHVIVDPAFGGVERAQFFVLPERLRKEAQFE